MIRWWPIGIVVSALLIGALGSACDGDASDDLADIRGTATAVAAKRLPPSATPDPVAAYREKASAITAKLGQVLDQMNKDMLAAATNQADPKWPGILNSDADQATQFAIDLQKLVPPDDRYASFAKLAGVAADSAVKAAKLLKQSVATADVNAGAQAFEALTSAIQQIPEAVKALPQP